MNRTEFARVDLHLSNENPAPPDCILGLLILRTKEQIMAVETLKDLYIDELKDIYSAETQLVKALPKMAKAAASEELRSGFEEHLEQTKGHVARLEQIFQALEEKPTGKKCMGMEGLIKEGGEAAGEDYEDDAKDAALIGAAQRVEHYEISGYTTARNLAQQLRHSAIVALLSKSLAEEENADQLLNQVARSLMSVAKMPAAIERS